MQRHCGTCGTDFDDETSLSVCPHHFGEKVQVEGYNQTWACLEELIMAELEDLVMECGMIVSIPNFTVEDLTLRRES